MPDVPPRASGAIDSYTWADGRTVTWRLRVRAYGRRHTIILGTNHEGWNEERAKVELDRVVAQIERGTWEIPSQRREPIQEPEQDPNETIHVTLSRWWQAKKPDIAENTQADYRWRLDLVLAFRPETLTSAIDERWVDELRDHLAAQPARNRKNGQKLKPASVNKVLELLAQTLDLAIDHKLMPYNPARGRRRKMKVPKYRGTWLEPDMVVDLLATAGDWEQALRARKRADQCFGRRQLIALLCLGGPRISEAIAADRGNFDLAGDHWRIPASKTPAGARTVELTVYCVEELRSHVASSARELRSRSPMWPTRDGGRLGQGNIRRMLREVVKRTNDRRGEEGKMLLPDVTPHSLRRTFASLCFFAGRDPAWVMGQLGHEDPRLALAVYAQTIQRKRIDRDLVWQLMRFADEPEEPPTPGRIGSVIGSVQSKRASDGSASILGT